jgi:hypothetical protein
MFWRWTRRLALVAVIVVSAFAASACQDVKDYYTIDPTPVVYTETFTGSLAPGGYNSHPFIVSVSGTVTMTLVTVTPDSTLQLGFDIGTWDGTNCNVVFGTGSRTAAQGYSFAGSAIVANFCARIYDAQNLIPVDSTVTYSMTVTHP